MATTLNDFITSNSSAVLFQYEAETNNGYVPAFDSGSLRAYIPDSQLYVPNFTSLSLNDHVDGMWIHPAYDAKVCTDSNLNGYCRTINGATDGPHYDWNQIQRNINGSDLKRNASSMILSGDKEKWKLQCCRNELTNRTNPQLCGQYWSQNGSVCGSMDCGTIVNGKPKIMADTTCATWCANNPNACDAIKIDFCRNNPQSPYCGCINDTAAAIAQRNEYKIPGGPRQCWPGSDCQKTDLSDTLIPAALRPVGCPDVQTQISEFIITNSTLIGNSFSQTMNNQKNNTQPVAEPVATAPSNFMIWIIVFIIFLIVSTVVAIIFLIDD